MKKTKGFSQNQQQDSLCPCGSGEDFSMCCEPLLTGKIIANSPEQLMRSRYTAFVQQHSEYLLRTWHSRTRPEYLNFADNPVTWLKLTINYVSEIIADSTSGIVDFTTDYMEKSSICTLREKSTFLREDDRWFYLNGSSDLQRKKVERNKLCPCGSGKKFKRCCLNK